MNEATIHSVLGTKKMIYDHSWQALTAAEISVQQGEAERGDMGSFMCLCVLCVFVLFFALSKRWENAAFYLFNVKELKLVGHFLNLFFSLPCEWNSRNKVWISIYTLKLLNLTLTTNTCCQVNKVEVK